MIRALLCKYYDTIDPFLHAGKLAPEHMLPLQELARAYPGKCPLFLCFSRTTGEIIFIETHEKFCVTPSLKLQQAANEQFGDETYYAKVDTSLPERTQRRWEKRPDSGGDE